jgi:hypothetical protein
MQMIRRADVASTLALGSLMLFATEALTGCCQQGQPCQNSGSIGPSTGEVVGAIVGVAGVATVGTVLAVNHHGNHNLRGCVSTGPSGLQLETASDKKTYSLVGKTADVKPGDLVKMHGTKEKRHKGNTGNQDFLVEKVTKDYGPCKVMTAAAVTPSTTDGN